MADGGVVERARALEQRIANLDRLRSEEVDATAVRTRAQQLDDVAEPLRGLARELDLLRANDIPVSLPVEAASAALAQHRERWDAYRADGATLVGQQDDSDFRYKYLQRLRSFSGPARGALLEAWQRHLELRMTALQPDLLDALERVPGFAEQVREVRDKRTSLDQIGERVPESQDAIDRANRLAEELRAQWENLSGRGLEPEVIDFLRLAGGINGAPIDLMSDRVRAWLTENGLLPHVRVRIVGGGGTPR